MNKIRMLGGAEDVRGFGRVRRRQAVRKVSKDLRGIIRFIVCKAKSKDEMFQNSHAARCSILERERRNSG